MWTEFHESLSTSATDDARRLLSFVSNMPIPLAWVSWHLYERPILSLKRFFVYERPAALAPEARMVGRMLESG